MRRLPPIPWTTSSFTGDGASVVAFDENGLGEVWPATLAAWQAHACAIAGRNLTRAEWQLYVHGRPYEKVCSRYPPG